MNTLEALEVTKDFRSKQTLL